MAISNVHVIYLGTTGFDLRKAVSWYTDPSDANKLLVRFQGIANTPVAFDKTTFEAAKTASLAAGG